MLNEFGLIPELTADRLHTGGQESIA